jgi:hypothetical protein
MVQQGRKMEVADALMEHLRGIPDPPLQELLDIIDYCTVGAADQLAADAAEDEAADAADTLPSVDVMPEASTESHITDPPIPSVVGGAVVPDCLAVESTAEALPRPPSPYWADMDEDVPFPMAEVVLPDPQVNAGVEAPPAARPPPPSTQGSSAG